MNWTLDTYKTWTGAVLVGVGAALKVVGLEEGEMVNTLGMVVLGIGGADKIRKQLTESRAQRMKGLQ